MATCGILSNPVNGNVSFTDGDRYASIATYTCSVGFNLVGNPERICQENCSWTGTDPICQSQCQSTCHDECFS